MNKYYLFISYSRSDSKAAAYLQRQLEHFRIPVKYVPPELLSGGQKFLRPVFRDKRDLETSEQSFTTDIKAALEDSRYLLVLCSPNSAGSVWVNEEVKHFLATHYGNFTKIVPVILEGRPGHGGNVECLPPELRRDEIISRNLPSMIPDDGEPVKAGWENGVVQSLSYMLKVDREKIKASVDREKLRQAKIYAIIGVCAAVIFAALTVWAVRAERIADRNEKRANKNAELARKNEAEAKTQADLARRNEVRATANEKRAVAGEKLAKDNEAKAKEQADIAKKSLEFLGDMFKSSDPTKKGSKDVKVLDAIKAKLPEIPKLTPWQLRASVSCDIASILLHLGEYDDALLLAHDALKLYAEHDSSEDIAYCCNCIGGIYYNQGKYDLAAKYFQMVLDIHLKLLGGNHPETAVDYNNLGLIYDDQGKYDLAVKHFQKALDIWLTTLSESHPNIATGYNNLGGVYDNLGKYDEAIKCYKKTLDIRLKLFGENYPDTATSYNNLGCVYENQGKYDEAVKYFRKALEIRLKVLGENHPDTATSYNNLGCVYENQGKYEEAVTYYKKSLSILQKNFGPFHRNTAASYNNLGFVYYKQGNCSESIAYYKKALDILQKIFGAFHPNVATGYNNIAMSYWKMGDKNKAMENIQRAIAILEKAVGKDHPRTKHCMKNLDIIKNQSPEK